MYNPISYITMQRREINRQTCKNIYIGDKSVPLRHLQSKMRIFGNQFRSIMRKVWGLYIKGNPCLGQSKVRKGYGTLLFPASLV